jgi:Cd2+/Zn2+-exporting ATPase
MGLSGLFAFSAEILSWVSGQERTWPVIVLAVASMVLGGRETLRKGFIALKTLTLNINFLMTLAIVGAASIGEWPEGAMVVFLLWRGRDDRGILA